MPTLATSAEVVLAIASVPPLLAAAYLLLLTLLSAKPPPPPYPGPRRRFTIVVPARDEEAVITDTIRSLANLDYPAVLRRILVVADNCADATAERARSAGAEVLERNDATRRGKGFALAAAFERILADGDVDAVVVVDADTVVAPDLLLAFSRRLDAGASAVQARYGVRDPDGCWRARVMALAFALVHDVRSAGRERLGCSAGLRGNGMCFAAETLRAVPYDAFSVVEDVEYGIRLGLSGIRVHYAGETTVLGLMASGERGSRTQRRRWEGGRRALARAQRSLPLRALLERDRVLLDLAADLLVPPLARLVAICAAGSAVSVAGSLAAGRPLVAVWLWTLTLPMLAAHVARGWWIVALPGRPVHRLADVARYVAWKARLACSASDEARPTWTRTEREPPP